MQQVFSKRNIENTNNRHFGENKTIENSYRPFQVFQLTNKTWSSLSIQCLCSSRRLHVSSFSAINSVQWKYRVKQTFVWLKLNEQSKTSFWKKLFFCVGEYAEYGFDQQGWYGMFVASGIWCLGWRFER